MKIIIVTTVVFFQIVQLSNGEVVNGMNLERQFPEQIGEVDYEGIRTKDGLSLIEVIRFGDSFLKSNFGENFKPRVFSVSYSLAKVSEGEFWCWVITYQHPEGGNNQTRAFRMYLSQDGKPLMKVSPHDAGKGS
jgi:hypothetical protein